MLGDSGVVAHVAVKEIGPELITDSPVEEDQLDDDNKNKYCQDSIDSIDCIECAFGETS